MVETQSSVMILLLAFFLWIGVCNLLRHRRLRLISSMDPIRDAVALSKLTLYVEFPFLSKKAIEFALFKTFAIPSISNLLAATRQFSPAAVNKRYDDTDILLQEMLLNHVDSCRGSLALRRLNFIHGRYNISNQDFLYTLSTFILEPKRFASKFGYREWTEKETMANFVVWRDIGTRMGIRDIPDTVEGVEIFSRQYEAQKMAYSDSNREIGDATLDLLLSIVPACLRPVGRRIAYCLLEERVLDAMGYPRQPYWLIWIVEVVLLLCVGNFVEWFLPPRPRRWSTERISVKEGAEEEEAAKVHKLRYSEYKPESYPNGYQINEVGSGKPGELGMAFGGDLSCPFFPSFSNPNSISWAIMASVNIPGIPITVLGFLFSYLALGAASNYANHEKNSESVVVVGKVFCDACLENRLSENGYVISGASIAVECSLNRKGMSVSVTGETNKNGEFKVEIPSHILHSADQLNKCWVKPRSSPLDSCKIPSIPGPTKLTLQSNSNGVLTYSAGPFSYRLETVPPSCYRETFLTMIRGRAMAEDADQSSKAGQQTPTIPSLPKFPPATLPNAPAFPKLSTPPLPSLPPLPKTPSLPSVPPLPKTPSLPSVPPLPKTPPLPSIPPLPNTPPLPSIPPFAVPTVPGSPLQIPNFQFPPIPFLTPPPPGH